MRTITIPIQNETTQTPTKDKNFIPARSAVVVGIFVFTGLAGLGFLALYTFPYFRVWPVALFPAGLFLAFTVSSALGILWTSWDVAGDWILRFVDWWKSRKIEPNMDPGLASDVVPVTEGQRIALASRNILEWHYFDGIQATRPECEERGVTQAEWNIINKTYQEIGLKTSRSWKVDDYFQALDLLRRDVYISDDGQVWVKNGQNGKKRIQ
mgnify:CR=1 FL=1